jgi:hypothetical protein
MATYYVAKFGNDAWNGGPATPFLTIQHAINTMVAGDTTNVETGTYVSSHLTFPNSGTTSSYITLQNYSGQLVNIVTNDSARSAVDTNGQSFIQIIGLNITGAGNQFGADADGGSYITFQNLTITNTLYSGILGEVCNYLTINGCIVYGTNTVASDEMISIQECTNFEIMNCTIHDPASTQRIGIDMKDTSSSGSCHNNIVYNITGIAVGIYVDASSIAHDISIYDNLVFNCPQSPGIEFNSESGTGSLTNMFAYNNLIYGCDSAFNLDQTGTETYTDCWFINNTCYNNAGAYGDEIGIDTKPTYMNNCGIRNNIIVETLKATIAIKDYNLCYTSGKLAIDHNDIFASGNGSFSAFSNYYPSGTNVVLSNPLLINPTTNFGLQANSPCIGTASAVGAPSTDFAGNPWTGCIGAYQYQAGTSFTHGTAYTASFTVTENPPGISCQVQIQVGTSMSSKVSFTSGSNVPVSIPITMPAAGNYPVYIDVYMEGVLIQTGIDSTQVTVV